MCKDNQYHIYGKAELGSTTSSGEHSTLTMRLLAKLSISMERHNGKQEEGALSDELQRTGSIQPHTAASKVCHNSGTEMKTKSTKLDQLAFISICLQFPQCRIPKQSHDEEKTARLTLPLEAAERTKVGKAEQTKNKKHTLV